MKLVLGFLLFFSPLFGSLCYSPSIDMFFTDSNNPGVDVGEYDELAHEMFAMMKRIVTHAEREEEVYIAMINYLWRKKTPTALQLARDIAEMWRAL